MNKNVIEKSNVLNCFESCKPAENMSLNEMRFFCMYLSKLNAREPNKRTVEIPLKEFEELFGVSINTTEFTDRLYTILRRAMYIKKDNKNKIINLYSEFEWSDDKYFNVLKVTCNYDIVPYLFELKSNYTTYRIANIAHLNSVTKIRLYELMKQFENIKIIEFELENLKNMIGSNISTFKLFHQQVIKPAVEDINKYTDIKVTYEKITQKRKVTAIQFRIGKNKNQKAISEKKEIVTNHDTDNTLIIPDVPKPIYTEPRTLKDLYKKYFTDEQYEQLVVIIKSHGISNTDVILKDALSALEEQMSQKKINSKIGYITNIVNNMIDDKLKPKSKKNQTYDIDEFERFAINDASLQKVYDEVFKDIMDAGFISADYETALKILKDNKEYKDLPKDKFNFIKNQMEGKRQAAEMMANI